MSELDQLREMVKRDGLEDFVEFASIEELVARQDAEIDRLRAELAEARKGPGVEELARVIRSAMHNTPIGEDMAPYVTRAIERALGRDAG